MSFAHSPLPYDMTALEPHISKETLEYHWGKHHKAYVDKLNAALENNAKLSGASLEEVIKSSEGGVYNNAAQVWNHAFYWQCLSGNGGGQPSEGHFLTALHDGFGSFEAFKETFSQKSATLFGSGWTFLVKNTQSGALEILSEGNAGCPLVHDHFVPLLTCDVWEHAYYVDYRNARPKYIEAFWKLVNWSFVESNYAAA
ncbi:MAG: superoxide dismutase [Proteobacteria bacterium]|nr:superoxide dismutase [Pseudomonadota bacterium]